MVLHARGGRSCRLAKSTEVTLYAPASKELDIFLPQSAPRQLHQWHLANAASTLGSNELSTFDKRF